MLRKVLFSLIISFATPQAYGDAKKLECEPERPTTISDIIANNEAILVGEMHGTSEMPAYFVQVVKTASDAGNSTVIALEYRVLDQPILDAVMKAQTEIEARTSLSALITNDGRTSNAMRTLVIDLWRMKKSGANITIAGVDYWPADYPDDDGKLPDWVPKGISFDETGRDVRMGQAALNACNRVNCDKLLFYAGNAHTRLKLSESSSYNPNTGEIRSFLVAPSGHVIAQKKRTAAIYLSHEGGQMHAVTAKGRGQWMMKPNTPDYVQAKYLPYCIGKPSSKHDYIVNVGKISAATDPFED